MSKEQFAETLKREIEELKKLSCGDEYVMFCNPADREKVVNTAEEFKVPIVTDASVPKGKCAIVRKSDFESWY